MSAPSISCASLKVSFLGVTLCDWFKGAFKIGPAEMLALSCCRSRLVVNRQVTRQNWKSRRMTAVADGRGCHEEECLCRVGQVNLLASKKCCSVIQEASGSWRALKRLGRGAVGSMGLLQA